MAVMSRSLARLCTVPLAAGLAVAVAAPASAHVSLSASTTAAGAYAVLTLSVPHGCDGSPTTRITIAVPDEITEVTPTRNALYDLRVVTEAIDPPVVAEDGDEVTERVSRIEYTAKEPLPDGQRDAFELSLQIPEDAAGTTLAFPTVQTCQEGSTAWTEVPADGGSAEDLEHPAPSFLVTAATSADGEEGEEDGSDATPLAVAGLVAGLLGLGLGIGALIRTRGVPHSRP